MFVDFTRAQAALRQEGNVYRFHRSTGRPPSGDTYAECQVDCLEWARLESASSGGNRS
jgi:hypothetical protein